MFWTLLTILGLIILISAAIAGVSAAPWLPTKSRDRTLLLENLDLKPGQKVVDLGCGDGSLLFGIARKFPGVDCVGYDISFLPLLMAWARKDFNGKIYKRVKIRFGNLFAQNVKEYDMVFVFLLAKSYPKLIEMFREQLKDDALVVVEAWPLPGIEPDKHLKKDGYLSLYFYSAKKFRQVQSG